MHQDKINIEDKVIGILTMLQKLQLCARTTLYLKNIHDKVSCETLI